MAVKSRKTAKKVERNNHKRKPKVKVVTPKTAKQNKKGFRKHFDLLRDNIIYLLGVCTIIFGTTAVLLSPTKVELSPSQTDFNVLSYYSDTLPAIPVLNNDKGIPIVSAQSVYAIDLNSGITLYEKNPHKKLYPASTTKILSALVAMEHYDLDQEVDIGSINVPGQRMGLIPGERISVEDLLYGLLVFSGNDAAEALAHNYVGGRSRFMDDMNLLAEELGLSDSYFTNPTGLDDNAQMTTARDLAVLSRFAMQNPTFSEIVATKEKVVEGTNGIGVHRLTNINELVGNVEGVMGVKTGWTEVARENLVTFVERDGKPVIIVVLGSQDRFSETEELIDWIYNNYEWKKATDVYSTSDTPASGDTEL